MDARELGFDEDRLERLVGAIESDVAAERYDGAAVLVARHGEIALHEAVGFAERASERRARTDDIFRWAEALRRGGELDGVRILSPALLDLATRNHTGQEPNHLFDCLREARGWDEYPAFLGLGFFLRGEGIFPVPFGLTASPRSFGGLGAGSTMFWVDPERDLVFVCLTAGLLEESRSFDRLQQLSDLVFSAVAD